MSFVKSQAIKSVAKAVEKMRPVKLRFAQDLEGASHLTMDTRKPIVKDPGLRIMQAVDAETGMTQGVLASWGSHPETLWSKNLMISSDYPHYFREGLEKGVYAGDSLVIAGLGGTAIFVNGAIGGLMCTRGSMPIESVFSDTVFTEPNFDKIEEQGKQLAMLSLKALKNKPFYSQTSKLSVRAKTVELAMKNKIFFLAAGLGLLDRGMSGWQKMKTEVAAFKIGKASFLCVPGEIYPELVNGGIDAPKGQDFNISPVEIPPLRELMPGKFKFVFGLANDEIGYIIPKSEWDNKEPFLYDGKKTYGEINSFGPETAPSLHRAFKNILEELN
jgi:hypothetical protein